MKRVFVRELRQAWPRAAILLPTEREVIITRDGRPVAELVALEAPVSKRNTFARKIRRPGSGGYSPRARPTIGWMKRCKPLATIERGVDLPRRELASKAACAGGRKRGGPTRGRDVGSRRCLDAHLTRNGGAVARSTPRPTPDDAGISIYLRTPRADPRARAFRGRDALRKHLRPGAIADPRAASLASADVGSIAPRRDAGARHFKNHDARRGACASRFGPWSRRDVARPLRPRRYES